MMSAHLPNSSKENLTYSDYLKLVIPQMDRSQFIVQDLSRRNLDPKIFYFNDEIMEILKKLF